MRWQCEISSTQSWVTALSPDIVFLFIMKVKVEWLLSAKLNSCFFEKKAVSIPRLFALNTRSIHLNHLTKFHAGMHMGLGKMNVKLCHLSSFRD